MSPAPFAGPTAAILIIGDEILSGKVDDENARYLTRELRGLGVGVRRVEIVPDEPAEISAAVATLSARFDFVFTSGGVGPTHDDVTLPAVAAAFGMALQRRPELEALIRQSFGGDFYERDLRMADIPAGARLEYGIPSRGSRWPVVAVHNVYVLPGVPSIFRRKFDTIRELFRSGAIFSRAVYSRDSEGAIAAALDTLVAAFPTVAVGSYPQPDTADHKVKITLDGRDEAAVLAAMAHIVAALGSAVMPKD